MQYGWGDWFIASQVSSVIAWPAIAITDVIFGDYLLPMAEAAGGSAGEVTMAVCGLSLVPKVAASYFGTHVYVPNAWWFWKLSLMPALPVSMLLSFAYFQATSRDKYAEPPKDPERPFDVVSWQQASDEFPHLDKAPPTNVANAAFQPSSTGPKSLSTRVLEAAPNPVQIAYQKWGSR